MSNVALSFVILTFNSEKYIEACLKSIDIAVEKLELEAEVFVVDNGSCDGTREILERFQFNKNIHVDITLLDHNTGTTYSRNIALKKCNGSFIVVLDSDAYVNTDVLGSLKSYLEKNPDCGLVVPRLVYPDGRYQLSVDRFPTIVRKIKRFLYLKRIETNITEPTMTDVDYAISAFWMFPEKILREVGLLDERIFYSPEDVDYCIRIWKAGYRITYLPKYYAVHDAQEISRAKGIKIINLFSLSHIKGLVYLYVKHGFLFSGKKFIR